MEAQERDNKPVTLAAMKLILQKISQETPASDEDHDESGIHIPALLRCVIRLMIFDIDKNFSEEDQIEKTDQLCRYFENSYDMAKQSLNRKVHDSAFTFDKEEYEWFSRTAYNTALKSCKSWPAECTLRLSEISLKFLDLYEQAMKQTRQTSAVMVDAILWQQIAAMYLTASAAVCLARERLAIFEQRELYQSTLRHTKAFSAAASKYLVFLSSSAAASLGDEIDAKKRTMDVNAKMAAMLSFEFEAAVNLEMWDSLAGIAGAAIRIVNGADSDIADEKPRNLEDLRIYESLVDILLSSSGPADG